MLTLDAIGVFQKLMANRSSAKQRQVLSISRYKLPSVSSGVMPQSAMGRSRATAGADGIRRRNRRHATPSDNANQKVLSLFVPRWLVFSQRRCLDWSFRY